MEADRVEAPAPDRRITGLSEWSTVTLLFLLAVVLRAAAAMRTVVMFNDGPIFLELARHMSEGEWSRGFSHQYHPLYSFLIFVFHFATGDWELAAVFISIVSGSAAVVALYFFLRHAFDPHTAWIGGLLLALLPYATTFSADIQSEGLYLALFTGALACLWRALQVARVRLAGLAGLLAGLAYLTRPEGIGVVAVGAGLAGLVLVRRGWSWRRGVSWLAALIAGAAIVAGPYVVFLRVEKGAWMLTQKKSLSNLVLPLIEETPAERKRHTESESGDGARGAAGAVRGEAFGLQGGGGPGVAPVAGRPRRELEGPVHLAGWVPVAARGSVGTGGSQRSALHRMLLACVSALSPPVVLLIGVGLYAYRGRPKWRGLFVAGFLAAYGVVIYGLAHNVGYVSRRHVLPPLLPLLGYAAAGVPIVGGFLLRGVPRWSPSPSLRARAAPWLCLALVSSYSVPKVMAVHRGHSLAARQAAEWLAGRPELSGPVATEKRRIAYYAGEKFVGLDQEGEEVDSATLYRKEARFLIIDEENLEVYTRLRNAQNPALRELHRVEAGGRRVFVFELQPRE